MQRTGRMPTRYPLITASIGTASRSRRTGSRAAAQDPLEQRLVAEFRRYTSDVPEDAFPSFLEALYFEPLK